MKRIEKYPDTKTFHYYNANPHRRITGDCVVRAISTATYIPYETVLREMCEMSLKTGYSIASKELIDRYLQSKGWIKRKQPRKNNNTKYTGEEFCREIMHYDSELVDGNIQRIVAKIGGHHIVAIMAGQIWDIWNSSDGCIGNYWVLPE